MRRSWSAKGLLSPLWGRVGGRDGLAERTGIHGPTLSGYNSGRARMGEDAGRRIAAALGVTLEELGAPPQEAHPSPILADLAAIKARIGDVEGDLQRQLEAQNRLLIQLAEVALELAQATHDLREATAALQQAARRRRPA